MTRVLTFVGLFLLFATIGCDESKTNAPEEVSNVAQPTANAPESPQASKAQGAALAASPEDAMKGEDAGEPSVEESATEAEPAADPEETAPDKEDDEAKKPPTCEQRKKSLRSQIKSIPRSCKRDSDCERVSFGCPFGCSESIPSSKEKRVETIKKTVEKFRRECPKMQCKYRCRPPGKNICDAGTCSFRKPKQKKKAKPLW